MLLSSDSEREDKGKEVISLIAHKEMSLLTQLIKEAIYHSPPISLPRSVLKKIEKVVNVCFVDLVIATTAAMMYAPAGERLAPNMALKILYVYGGFGGNFLPYTMFADEIYNYIKGQFFPPNALKRLSISDRTRLGKLGLALAIIIPGLGAAIPFYYVASQEGSPLWEDVFSLVDNAVMLTYSFLMEIPNPWLLSYSIQLVKEATFGSLAKLNRRYAEDRAYKKERARLAENITQCILDKLESGNQRLFVLLHHNRVLLQHIAAEQSHSQDLVFKNASFNLAIPNHLTDLLVKLIHQENPENFSDDDTKKLLLTLSYLANEKKQPRWHTNINIGLAVIGVIISTLGSIGILLSPIDDIGIVLSALSGIALCYLFAKGSASTATGFFDTTVALIRSKTYGLHPTFVNNLPIALLILTAGIIAGGFSWPTSVAIQEQMLRDPETRIIDCPKLIYDYLLKPAAYAAPPIFNTFLMGAFARWFITLIKPLIFWQHKSDKNLEIFTNRISQQFIEPLRRIPPQLLLNLILDLSGDEKDFDIIQAFTQGRYDAHDAAKALDSLTNTLVDDEEACHGAINEDSSAGVVASHGIFKETYRSLKTVMPKEERSFSCASSCTLF